MKNTILILMLLVSVTFSMNATDPANSDSTKSTCSESELIEKVLEMINEALYKTDNELPEFGKASLVITFGVDYLANFKLLSIEGSDQIINYLVREKLEDANIKVNDNLKCRKFIMPVTYNKRPWYEACKKGK